MPGEKKVIAVIGGTGHQGIGLIRAIMSEGDNCEFTVRAVTKDASSETAQWLKKNNVEIFDADVSDEARLTEALRGCYGVYAVTFYWHHMNPEEELRQARSIANAAKKNNVKHVVWSTLEDTRDKLKNSSMPTLNDKYKVPPFDVKAEADRFFSESGIPTTYYITPFYWENFIDMGMEPKKATDGNYELALPMGNARLAGMSAEDVGRCALTLFKRPEEYANKRVGVRSEDLTVKDMADKMSKALGKTVRYRDITPDEYRKQTFPGCKDLGNMFQYYQECENDCVKLRCADNGRKLCPNMLSFDQWLAKYKEHIPLRA